VLADFEATDADWILRLIHSLGILGRLIKTMPRNEEQRCRVYDSLNELVLALAAQGMGLRTGHPVYPPDVFARIVQRLANDRGIGTLLGDAIAITRSTNSVG
jgi:hypothetical protein